MAISPYTDTLPVEEIHSWGSHFSTRPPLVIELQALKTSLHIITLSIENALLEILGLIIQRELISTFRGETE